MYLLYFQGDVFRPLYGRNMHLLLLPDNGEIKAETCRS